MKRLLKRVLHPLRGPVTRACQRGYLTPKVARVLPSWSWVLEPFTIYGDGWQVQWHPTELDTVAHRIFWTGLREWEAETAPVMFNEIRRARCFIDIGANTGIYSVIGKTINPAARVIAVEPTPHTYGALRRNIDVNALDIEALNIAVGATDGIVPFHVAEDATMCSLNTGGYRGQSGHIIEVRCHTLDSVVHDRSAAPDFLKIDVEGFEAQVLSGASETLRRFRPRIVLEANPGDATDAVSAILAECGYRFHHITEAGPEERPQIVAHPKFTNWLCVPAACSASAQPLASLSMAAAGAART